MILIVGLGNPGLKYQTTRHNAGWQFLDALVAHLGTGSWQEKSRLHAQLVKTNFDGEQVVLVKPTTYMNDSGRAVRAVMDFYNLDLTQGDTLIVAFDDLDIEVGAHKLQFAKGPREHNGLNSTYQHLGNDQFWHLRLGVDGRGGERRVPSRDYVLLPFSPAEQSKFQQVLVEAVADSIRCIQTA